MEVLSFIQKRLNVTRTNNLFGLQTLSTVRSRSPVKYTDIMTIELLKLGYQDCKHSTQIHISAYWRMACGHRIIPALHQS